LETLTNQVKESKPISETLTEILCEPFSKKEKYLIKETSGLEALKICLNNDVKK
jgi:hypothetical protein